MSYVLIQYLDTIRCQSECVLLITNPRVTFIIFWSLFSQFSALSTKFVIWEISSKATLQSQVNCKTMYTKIDIQKNNFISISSIKFTFEIQPFKN